MQPFDDIVTTLDPTEYLLPLTGKNMKLEKILEGSYFVIDFT